MLFRRREDGKADQYGEPERCDADHQGCGHGDFKGNAVKGQEGNHGCLGPAKTAWRAGQPSDDGGKDEDADGHPEADVGAQPHQQKIEGIAFRQPSHQAKAPREDQNRGAGKGAQRL